MTDEKEKTTVLDPSVGADGGQPSQICADIVYQKNPLKSILPTKIWKKYTVRCSV